MLHGVIFDITDCIPDIEISYMKHLIRNLTTSGLKVTTTESSGFAIPSLTPEECLVITDTASGVVTAKAAGIPCIGYIPPLFGRENISGTQSLIESFDSVDVDYLRRTHAHVLSYPAEILTTEHLFIREFSVDDFPALYAMCTAPETASFMEEQLSDYSTEQKKHAAYLQNVYPLFDLALWGIYEKDTGHLVGRAGFSLPMEDSDTFSLGYLIDVPYRGRGYAKECIPALLIYAKEQGYTTVSARIKKENLISINVLEQCGFPYVYTTDTTAGVRIYTIRLAE